MRLSSSLAALFVFASTVVHAAPEPLDSRQVDTLTTGGTVDVCADLDIVIKVPDLFHPGKTITVGAIKACVCKSDLHNFCGTNLITIAASALIGKDKVEKMIGDYITNSSTVKTCKYPPHASPQCKKGSPCFFTCKDGYTASPAGDFPTSCICKKPYTECNGKCGYYPSCHSRSLGKRDAMELWGRDKKCGLGLSACGVLGGRARAWECVDTQSDLESCGGCIVPLYYGAPGRTGTDCSALPGVLDVSCVRGGCMVHRCEPGYEISRDRTSCIYDEERDPVLLAAEYGLEHTTWPKKKD